MKTKLCAEKGENGEHKIMVYRRGFKQDRILIPLGYLERNPSITYNNNNVSYKPINNEMLLEEEMNDIIEVSKNFNLFFENLGEAQGLI